MLKNQLSWFGFRFKSVEHHFTNLPIKSKPKMESSQKTVWVKPNKELGFALRFGSSHAASCPKGDCSETSAMDRNSETRSSALQNTTAPGPPPSPLESPRPRSTDSRIQRHKGPSGRATSPNIAQSPTLITVSYRVPQRQQRASATKTKFQAAQNRLSRSKWPAALGGNFICC